MPPGTCDAAGQAPEGAGAAARHEAGKASMPAPASKTERRVNGETGEEGKDGKDGREMVCEWLADMDPIIAALRQRWRHEKPQ